MHHHNDDEFHNSFRLRTHYEDDMHRRIQHHKSNQQLYALIKNRIEQLGDLRVEKYTPNSPRSDTFGFVVIGDASNERIEKVIDQAIADTRYKYRRLSHEGQYTYFAVSLKVR